MSPLLLLLGALAVISAREVRTFEDHAAREISSKLHGEGRAVKVRSKIGPEALFGDVFAVTIKAQNFTTEGLPLFTEPSRSTRGILRQLNLELTDFYLRDLHVQRMAAAIPDCRFDLGLALGKRQIRLSRSGVGPGEVELSAQDIANFIPIKFREVKRCTVRLEKDKVFVDGYGEFVLFAAEFSVVARVEAQDGNKLILSHARVLIDGKPADPAAASVLIQTLNPVIDLNKDLLLYDAMNVKRIRVAGGKLIASGDTRIPVKGSP